jgi:hypothetical protein
MNDFILKLKEPLDGTMSQMFPTLPEEGQRLTVLYSLNHHPNSTNDSVYYRDNKFVNDYGSEMYGIMGWKPYKQG